MPKGELLPVFYCCCSFELSTTGGYSSTLNKPLQVVHVCAILCFPFIVINKRRIEHIGARHTGIRGIASSMGTLRDKYQM